jgi:putative transposase
MRQKEFAMPRKPRMYLADMPCLEIQHGNSRDACFYADQDYLSYLDCLRDACERYHVAVHAYDLIANHVHLLMTPENAEGISRVMQSVGRSYAQYLNLEYHRSATVWEGRHKASLVDAENYLLICMRYIELNPVRADMVEHPVDYRWPSFRFNGLTESSKVLSPHSVYLMLDMDISQRTCAYRSLFRRQMDDQDLHAIREAIQFSVPSGNGRFKQQLESALCRSTGYAKRGRPGRAPLITYP